MALIGRVEPPTDGDLVRERRAFAAERLMEIGREAINPVDRSERE